MATKKEQSSRIGFAPGRLWIVMGALSGFTAVMLGAFGAHALKERISAEALGWHNTGAQYQMVHALALVLLGIWQYTLGQRLRILRDARGSKKAEITPEEAHLTSAVTLAQRSGWFFLVGTLFFCLSLYAMAMTDLRWLGMITPLGGTSFLLAWLFWALSGYRAP